jgi:hypothetical protein
MTMFDYRAVLFNTSTKTLPRLNCPAPGQAVFFGYAVGANNDILVVGSDENPYGGAYVFRQDTGVFLGKLPISDPVYNGHFGRTVVVHGGLTLVGAPFGKAMAKNVSYAGRVYVFDVSLAGIKSQGALESPNPQSQGVFGAVIACAGPVIVVSAPEEQNSAGAVYVFDAVSRAYKGALAAPQPKAYDRFGFSIATDGNVIAVGCPHHTVGKTTFAGTVDLYDVNRKHIKTISLGNAAESEDYFGAAVAIRDGMLLVGAPGRTVNNTMSGGEVFMFDAATGAGPAGSPIANPNPVQRVSFGRSIVIGDAFTAIGCGDRNPPPVQYPASFVELHSANGKFISELGTPPGDGGNWYAPNLPAPAIAFAGKRLAVGAPAETVNGAQNAGAVYRYEMESSYLVAPINAHLIPIPIPGIIPELPVSQPGVLTRG